GCIGDVDVDCKARMSVRVAVAGHGDHPVNEIRALRWNWNWSPAQLVGRRRHFVKWGAAQLDWLDGLKGLMRYRRPYAIQPCAAVGDPRRGERSSTQLLGVQTVGNFLRRVL